MIENLCVNYTEKLFNDIFVCDFVPGFIFKIKDSTKININFCFSYENDGFYFTCNDFTFNIGNILAYQYFRKYLISKLINYGFELIADKKVLNDVESSIVKKGQIEENILVLGNVEQLRNLYLCEMNKNNYVLHK